MSRRAHFRMKQKVGPTGATIWTTYSHSVKADYYWNGPGGRIYLMWYGQLISVDRPGMDHGFRSRTEAAKALRHDLSKAIHT